MITCERCHTENLDGAQYCDECGAELGGQSSRSIASGDVARGEAGENGGASAEAELPSATRDASDPVAARHSQVIAPAAQTSVAAAGPVGKGATVASSEAARGMDEVAHAKLVIDRGRSVGKEFLLSADESHIGRWDADGGIFPDVDLDTDDPEAKVSRRHARITRRAGHYYIEDLGSTNGTFVNRGRRLLPGDRQPLRDGDEVIVGKTFLRFHVL
jgi:hypothetical protein